MKKKAIEEIKNLILEKEKEGKVVIATCEGLASMDINDLILQPTEGLLYDLNRDRATIMTNLKDVKWINDYACMLVIIKLKEMLENK